MRSDTLYEVRKVHTGDRGDYLGTQGEELKVRTAGCNAYSAKPYSPSIVS